MTDRAVLVLVLGLAVSLGLSCRNAGPSSSGVRNGSPEGAPEGAAPAETAPVTNPPAAPGGGGSSAGAGQTDAAARGAEAPASGGASEGAGEAKPSPARAASRSGSESSAPGGVAALIAAAPASSAAVTVTGQVVYQRPCPVCPAGVTCKPCDPFLHVVDEGAGQSTGLVIIGVPAQASFRLGQRYTFEAYGFEAPATHSLPGPPAQAGPAPVPRAQVTYRSHRAARE